MTPTQRRILGRTLKTLALALDNGRWPADRLAELVEQAKPGLDALHAEICKPTPWDYVTERMSQAADKIETVTKSHQLKDAVAAPEFPGQELDFTPHYTEPVYANGGMDRSLPVGDRG